MLSFVSLEYRTLSKTTSRKQDTGIIVSFAIWSQKLDGKKEVLISDILTEKANKRKRYQN